MSLATSRNADSVYWKVIGTTSSWLGDDFLKPASCNAQVVGTISNGSTLIDSVMVYIEE
jgi:hypothetical protein